MTLPYTAANIHNLLTNSAWKAIVAALEQDKARYLIELLNNADMFQHGVSAGQYKATESFLKLPGQFLERASKEEEKPNGHSNLGNLYRFSRRARAQDAT